ncbi:MAG: hypothetical protein JW751_21050, partial [Polyangiaceae bacterium]|nr:hypothetical protein [Polyangiaceae bacterium]
MPNTIRLLLQPAPPITPVGLTGAPITIEGFELDCSGHGAGKSNAVKDSPQPASIELKARLLKSVRREPELFEKDVARLDGEVSFSGSPPRVSFRLSPDSIAQLQSSPEPPPEEGASRPRALLLRLAPGSFGLSDLPKSPLQLLLPP